MTKPDLSFETNKLRIIGEADPSSTTLEPTYPLTQALVRSFRSFYPEAIKSTDPALLDTRKSESKLLLDQGKFIATTFAVFTALGMTVFHGSPDAVPLILIPGGGAGVLFPLSVWIHNRQVYQNYSMQLEHLNGDRPVARVPQVKHIIEQLSKDDIPLEQKVAARGWLQSLHNATGRALKDWVPSQGDKTRPDGSVSISHGPKYNSQEK